jgi:hypothetical protein
MKRLLTACLLILLVNVGIASETRYDKLVKTLEKRYEIKYNRRFTPQLRFYDTETNGYTFEGNADYEIFIDALMTELYQPDTETPWYKSFETGFISGTAVTILIMFAVK